ncbi:MAG: hypothetical protein ACI9U0_002037, partial [Flavobacteriales bacterium]
PHDESKTPANAIDANFLVIFISIYLVTQMSNLNVN